MRVNKITISIVIMTLFLMIGTAACTQKKPQDVSGTNISVQTELSGESSAQESDSENETTTETVDNSAKQKETQSETTAVETMGAEEEETIELDGGEATVGM